MPINVEGSDKTKRENDLTNDEVLATLREATPAQINAYIEANITDLASAKVFLKRLSRLCVYMLRRLDP